MPATLGKYHIQTELGKGGFATVYRAVDTTLDREVALKVLDPLLMRDATWAERFRREAKTIAALKHPSIVTIYEVGEVEGRLYLAMELAAGGSLADAIAAHGRLPWTETLALLKPVCEALDYAHDQGVIHRDLKPANILLTAEGQPLLTDFGFARLLGDNSMSLSLSGGILGTPAYIAPEVWELDAAATPADIYALGCIVYEMLTGKVLFQSKTPMQAVRAHDQGPKYTEKWPEETPYGLTATLDKALARDPGARYPTAGTFWHALNALESQAETARQAAQLAAVAAQWCAETEAAIRAQEWSAARMMVGRWLKAAPGDTDALMAQQQIETAMAEQTRKQQEIEQERLRSVAEQERQKQAAAHVTTETAQPRAGTGTAGGYYAQQGVPDTHAHRAKGSVPVSVPPVMPAKSTPDQNSQAWKWLAALGALIACAFIVASLGERLTPPEQQETAVLPTHNTVATSTVPQSTLATPTTIAESTSWIIFERWLKDPNESSWGYEVELWLVRPDGSGLYQLTQGDRNEEPAWSPSGQRIAFARQTNAGRGIFVADLDDINGGEFIVNPGSHAFYPKWVDEDRIIYTAPGGPEEEFSETWRLYTISSSGGNPQMIDVGLPGAFSPVISPNGRDLVFHAGDDFVYITTVEGQNVQVLDSPSGLVKGYPHAWYPDGQHIVVGDGGDCLKVSVNDFVNLEPLVGIGECNISWSPDGSQAVYQFGNSIWIMDVDGNNKHLLVEPNDDSHYKKPVWSP